MNLLTRYTPYSGSTLGNARHDGGEPWRQDPGSTVGKQSLLFSRGNEGRKSILHFSHIPAAVDSEADGLLLNVTLYYSLITRHALILQVVCVRSRESHGAMTYHRTVSCRLFLETESSLFDCVKRSSFHFDLYTRCLNERVCRAHVRECVEGCSWQGWFGGLGPCIIRSLARSLASGKLGPKKLGSSLSRLFPLFLSLSLVSQIDRQSTSSR